MIQKQTTTDFYKSNNPRYVTSILVNCCITLKRERKK
jgi:hypothetical protein